jgi:activating signal cointegrator complex subunit 2
VSLSLFLYTRSRSYARVRYPAHSKNVAFVAASDDAMTVLRDRSFIEQMKVDILRRVEEPSDSDGEEINVFGGVASDRHSKDKGKVREVAFNDELDEVSSVCIAGDGEESSEDDEDEEESEMDLQTILELAYIANPKVFERDAATRRSKERAVLRAQTGASKEKMINSHPLSEDCAFGLILCSCSSRLGG